MRTDTGQVFRLEDYKPSPWLIPETNLSFDLGAERTVVTARLTLARREGIAETVPVVLDGDGLDLLSLAIDDRPAPPEAYEATPDGLVIHRPPRSGRFTLTVQTVIDPSRNTALMGLYRSNGVYCTQCEAEGFRRITYFLDRPDILSVYEVRIEADRGQAPILLSNGNPVEAGELAGGRHYAVWHDPFPKPSYLFAMVAGDLARLPDTFVTASGRRVDLGIYVEHGKQARASYAMDALKRSMKWDEEVFGLEYDLDVFNIVAVSDFNMGAMENKGLNIFNDKYVLADMETATDADFAAIEAIVAHEYFHNWTGNRITCRDWFQLCLKEGLTVFRDHEFSADQRSRPVKRIAEVRALKAHQFPEDQGPLAHPVRPRRYREINNFYTATVYEKGSELVRMIRAILGAEAFRAGMRLYIERHDGEAATVENFLKAFEDASGIDLGQFALWYHQAGTPNLVIRTGWNADAGTFTLEIEQSTPPTPGESRKRLLHIPLAIGLVGPDGRDMEWTGVEGAEVAGGVVHLRKRRHVVRFSGLPSRPAPSLNRGFSAPVTIAFSMEAEDRAFLARHDGDQVARWEALNGLALEHLKDASRRRRGRKPAQLADNLAALLGTIAADDELDPAYRALCLTLPGEGDIARELGRNIDPDAILAAREALVAVIARSNLATFEAIYRTMRPEGPFRPDAASAGRRALRNVMLDFLSAATGDPALANAQYRDGADMTSRAAALAVLVSRFRDTPESRAALEDFERRHGGDPLVMDKWFQIQAAAPGPEAVETVAALSRHRLFQMDNPNRVRSLFGAFATLNQTGFHRADGAGYALFADTVLAADRRNPQLAARLATALRSWRSLEAERRENARRTLVRIAAATELSTDLRDIVERTLA